MHAHVEIVLWGSLTFGASARPLSKKFDEQKKLEIPFTDTANIKPKHTTWT